jgi:hypothetical protein
MSRKEQKTKNRTASSSRSGVTMMIVRAIITMVVVGGVVIGAGAGLQRLQDQVRARQTPAEPTLLQVRFAQAPIWMPVSLQNEIASKLVPPSANFGDAQLAEQIFDLAKQEPWIRQVKFVHKGHTSDPNVGLVEVGAQFRLPIARVQKDNRYYYIDSEAVPLPVDQVPRYVTTKDVCYLDESEIPPDTKYSTIHYMTIRGVGAAAPKLGQHWEGADLADALRLIRLIENRPYANQIASVDVRNSGESIKDEPSILMIAQGSDGKSTDIKFGRFPIVQGGDPDISPQRKLAYLDAYYADHGRLAGLNRYLDLRYDQLHISVN